LQSIADREWRADVLDQRRAELHGAALEDVGKRQQRRTAPLRIPPDARLERPARSLNRLVHLRQRGLAQPDENRFRCRILDQEGRPYARREPTIDELARLPADEAGSGLRGPRHGCLTPRRFKGNVGRHDSKLYSTVQSVLSIDNRCRATTVT